MRQPECGRALGLALALALAASASAAVVTWDGGAGASDQKWTTDGVGGNWSGATMPGTADTAVFDESTSGGSHGALTNVADASFTIDTLSYDFGPAPASFFHTTDIAAGTTLLATDGMNVAPVNATSPYTIDVTVTSGAGGTLQVGNAGAKTADMVVAYTPNYTGWSHVTTNLDLSGLDTFATNLSLLDLAHGRSWNQRAFANVTLAPTNTINADKIDMGRAVGTATLALGQSNTVRTDTWHIGSGKNGNNAVSFQAPGGTLDLAGLDNPGTDLYISYNLTNTSSTVNDSMDLSGGTFNATLDDAIIGYFPHNYKGACRGTLTMDAGTVTANSLQIALSNCANPDPDLEYWKYAKNTRGTLTINGGSFTVNGNLTDGNGITTINLNGGALTVNGTTSFGNGIDQVVTTEDFININGGTFTANGDVTGGTHTSTLNVDDGTFAVTGSLTNVTNLRVGHNGGTGTVTVAGGAVSIGASSDLKLGLRDDGVYGPTTTGTLDLSGATSASLTLDSLRLGVSNATGARGILLLSPDNTIHATTILMGDNTAGGSIGIDSQITFGAANEVHTDTFTIGARKSEALVDIVPGGELDLSGETGAATDLRIGYNSVSTGSTTVGTLDLSGGTFNATLDEVVIGLHNNLGGAGQGSLIMDAGTVTANSVVLARPSAGAGGTSSSPLNTQGTLTMRGGTFTVNGSLTDGGGTSEVQIDGGDLVVNGALTVDTLRVGRNGGTGTVAVAGGAATIGASGNLDIGCRTSGYTAGTPVTYGTLDLSAATSATLDLTSLRLGVTNGIKASGVLLLSPDNTITATTITVGDNPSTGSGGMDNRITLGELNAINVDTFYVGRKKSDGVVNFAAGLADPVLTLRGADGTSRVNFLGIGYNDTSTASANTSTVDLSGGRVDALVDSMTIGRHIRTSGSGGKGDGSLVLSDDPGNVLDANAITLGQISGAGTATANGTITMRDGTFTVHGSVLDGTGGSTLNLDGGTMTVGGDLDVDALRVGYLTADGGGAASLTVNGANVRIGASGDLDIGRRTIDAGDDMADNFEGRLDLRDAASVTIDVDNLRLGVAQTETGGNPGGQVRAQGTLLLSEAGSNSIDAAVILLGDVPGGAGNMYNFSTITFGGAINTVRADTLTVGGRKGSGAIAIVGGGTLDLSGLAGAKPDLAIANNNTGTNSVSRGTLDVSAGTFNAALGQVIIARSPHSSTNGNGIGQMILGPGAVTADSVTMAETAATNAYRTTALLHMKANAGSFAIAGDLTGGRGLSTLQLDGGTLTIGGNLSVPTGTATVNLAGGVLDMTGGEIDLGSPTPDLNFVGGTLKDCGTFHGTLVQDGGLLRPGASPGTTAILGDYDQNAGGTLEIEIQAPGDTAGIDFDFVDVTGAATLDGTLDVVLLGGYTPGIDKYFDVLTGTSVTLGETFGLDQSAAPFPSSNFFMASVVPGGRGEYLRLTVVPEPATLSLLALGGLGLAARRRRRRA